MAEVTITAQNPSNNVGRWGDKRFQKYYNRYLGELPKNTVNYNALSTQQRSAEEMAQEVASYLDPQLETTAKNLRRQTRQNYNTIDTEGAGRGMSRSTWVTDEKNAIYNAEMQGLADAYNSYNDALVSGVAEAYENQAARQQAIDQQNQKNQMETDQFNSQIETAQEQLAYDRARQAWLRTRPKPQKHYGTKPGYTPPSYTMDWLTKDGKKQIKVRDKSKRRISGQSSGL